MRMATNRAPPRKMESGERSGHSEGVGVEVGRHSGQTPPAEEAEKTAVPRVSRTRRGHYPQKRAISTARGSRKIRIYGESRV